MPGLGWYTPPLHMQRYGQAPVSTHYTGMHSCSHWRTVKVNLASLLRTHLIVLSLL